MTPGIDRRASRANHNGWTQARRRLFLERLAAKPDVSRACAHVGISRQSAYRLRNRDAGFAVAWDGALENAYRAEREAFLAALPEFLRRTLSDASDPCHPGRCVG